MTLFYGAIMRKKLRPTTIQWSEPIKPKFDPVFEPSLLGLEFVALPLAPQRWPSVKHFN